MMLWKDDYEAQYDPNDSLLLVLVTAMAIGALGMMGLTLLLWVVVS